MATPAKFVTVISCDLKLSFCWSGGSLLKGLKELLHDLSPRNGEKFSLINQGRWTFISANKQLPYLFQQARNLELAPTSNKRPA